MNSRKIQLLIILSIFVISACGGGNGREENSQIGDLEAVVRPEKTIANLKTAITNESNASAKYKVLALKAEREGYKNIAKMFEAASFAEHAHASFQSVLLNMLSVQFLPETEIPVIHSNMKANIEDIIQTQTMEFSNVYPSMIEDAKAESIDQAILSFTFATEAKKKHVELYEQALVAFAKKNNDKTVSNQWYVCFRCGCLFNDILDVDACTICGEVKGNFRKF